MSSIRIGNGAGFWGDNLDAPVELARGGDLDVLTLEYLAELTMAILSHLRTRDASAGYVGDFPDVLERLVPMLGDQPRLAIVTNAGGLNPGSCVRKCGSILDRFGLGEIPLAMVNGDDLLDRIPELIATGIDLAHLETGEPISTVAAKLVCCNAYIGARSIALAIESGGRVVVTGRVADASLTLGPAQARYGWAWDDWDKLAGASVAGHLIECGAQVTGGLWHDWKAVPDLANIGYPIAEVEEDGSCVITKPEGSGGMVTPATVAAQLVYEIGNPQAYLTPDVSVDLTTVKVEEPACNRVRVSGAKGNPRPEKLKVSAVYRDGWMASGLLAVVGLDAEEKARAAGKIVLDRLRKAGFEFARSNIECLGAGYVVPGVLDQTIVNSTAEVVLRVTVRDPRKAAVERFCRELAPLVTSGPAGIAGYAGGRPKPMPAFGYWPTLIARDLVEAKVEVRSAVDWIRQGN